LFRYVNKNWLRVELKELPVKRLRSNLTYGISDHRKEIERSHYHLSVQQTQASIHNYKVWLMDFSGLKEQSFGVDNCHRESDYRIVPITPTGK